MKTLAFCFGVLFPASLAAQSTINLSQSTVFQSALLGKADKASPTITGTAIIDQVNVKGVLSFSTNGTNQFYAGVGDGPFFNFAPSTFLQYANARYEFWSAGSNRLYIGSDITSNVPFYGTTSINLKGPGPDFYLGRNSSRPYIAFDGFASRIEYDQNGHFVFWQGNKKVARLDGGNGNLFLRGSVTQNLGNSCC